MLALLVAPPAGAEQPVGYDYDIAALHPKPSVAPHGPGTSAGDEADRGSP